MRRVEPVPALTYHARPDIGNGSDLLPSRICHNQPVMHTEITSSPDASGLRIGIAVSRYHGEITNRLLEGAKSFFLSHGGSEENLIIMRTPGAFELTVACRALAEIDTIEAVIALGCVISGETTHDQYINQSIIQGLTTITTTTGLPVGFGVLTCQTMKQARVRAGGAKGNKGEEAMAAVIEMANTLQALWADEESS